MLQGLFSGRALSWFVGKQRPDEALAVLRDGLPDTVFERELTLTNLLHDILVRLAVERRHARKQNVGDHTSGPDIALMVVVLVEDLWSDIVWRAEFFVEATVWVIDERGTEVDDLNLVEFLILLEQDILWLQVTMHDVCLMAVVDA